MMEAELCSTRQLLSPSPRVLSPSRDESGDEELSVLPRHTKVIVTGNNRTKSVLVGLQGVVKKAVGLGGWHWLVLKNGMEVKLQRNALMVLEAPTGNEDDEEDNELDNSFCSSSDMGDRDHDYSSIDFQKPTKPRVRHTRPWRPSSSAKSSSRGSSHGREIQSHPYKAQTVSLENNVKENRHDPFGSNLFANSKPNVYQRVNLSKLGTSSLWRYSKHYNLVTINPNPTKEQLLHVVQRHFVSQKHLDEMQVILGFIQTAKKLKSTIYA